MSERSDDSRVPIRVTVSAEAIAALPDSALGAGSMITLTGTTDDGRTVFFKDTEDLTAVKREGSAYVVNLEPEDLLKPGEE